jgi:hypothetical protein
MPKPNQRLKVEHQGCTMSHKRPSHHNDKGPRQQPPSASPSEPYEHTCYNQEEPKRNYEPPPDQKRKWGLTKFEWIIACLTTCAVAVAFFTALFIYNQLDDMRKDQRPWVRAWMDFAPIQVQNPIISGTMHILNSGKTPAKSVNATFFVEKVVNGKEPNLADTKPFAKMVSGAKFPNIPADSPLTVYSISQPELGDLNAGRIFFVVYGTVTYTDFFRTQHWTKFCVTWILAPGNYTSKKCAEYDDVDNN